MIDETEFHLARVDRVEDQAVLLIRLYVVRDEALEPLPGHIVTLRHTHRRYEGLEGGIGWCNRDLALPLRIRQIKDRLRDLVSGHLLRVVGNDARATTHTGPGAIGGAVVLRHQRCDRRRQRRKEAGGRYGTQRSRILGEVDVSRARVTLLQ